MRSVRESLYDCPGVAGDCRSPVGLAQALNDGVLPGKLPVRAIALAGIEVLLLAVDIDDGDVVIQLRQSQVAGYKNAAIAIGYNHQIRLHSSGAGHGDKELGNLIVAAAFALPDVVGVLHLAEALGLLLGRGVFAVQRRVVQLHDGGVNLPQLLVLRVGWSDQIVYRRFHLGVRPDEFVAILRPALALVLPELVLPCDTARSKNSTR